MLLVIIFTTATKRAFYSGKEAQASINFVELLPVFGSLLPLTFKASIYPLHSGHLLALNTSAVCSSFLLLFPFMKISEPHLYKKMERKDDFLSFSGP